MSPLIKYFRDTAAELKQVTWPSQRQAALYTVLVIVISTFVAIFTGAFDFLFSRGVEQFINRF
jgi:preprotein translocase subunit SecE